MDYSNFKLDEFWWEDFSYHNTKFYGKKQILNILVFPFYFFNISKTIRNSIQKDIADIFKMIFLCFFKTNFVIQNFEIFKIK